ncbi:MAG TPA: hypothetical protein VFU97_03725 [Xanthobacteraceae bacterium]|nr:hypothetical protein [Xanthobacteraceae bacterium]
MTPSGQPSASRAPNEPDCLEEREYLERQLKKSPDFHLYLLTRSRKDRARMEQVLLQIPAFRRWHLLTSMMQPALDAS